MREVEAQRAAMATPGEYGILLEHLCRRDREAVGDVRRPVGDFEQMIAYRTAILPAAAMARAQFDPSEARVASGADDVAFFHDARCPIICASRRDVPAGSRSRHRAGLRWRRAACRNRSAP